ncbi:Uncharacterised protein [Achromobacter sp. 2789STDY5608615]|nr:Uncharacterised protein [Achromobacter sp. 2789STDY5608615]
MVPVSAPPVAILATPATLPVPPRLAPAPTLTCELVSEPVTFRLPPATLNRPVCVFTPDSVSAPVPFLTMLPAPLSTPPKTESALFCPICMVALAPSARLPAPLSEPNVSLSVSRSVVPAARLTARLSASACPPRVSTVPDSRFRPPVKVLMPFRINVVLLPSTSTLPLPLMAPL